MRIRTSILLILVSLLTSYSVPENVNAETIDEIRSRGHLKCGVLSTYPGFGFLDAHGNYQGFDIEFCRAIGAALNVDVQYTELSGKTRFPALLSGQVDVVLMLVTQTMRRETKLALDFPAINYYDGQAFMVRRELQLNSAHELDGASVCLTSGATGEINVADFFRKTDMTYRAVTFEKIDDSDRAYDEGRCDAVTSQSANLSAHRALLSEPEAHIVLPELISKEPMGPVTRSSDRQWSQAVKYIVHALILAEENGVTKANVDVLVQTTRDPEIRRLLGVTGSLGPDAGLPQDWALNAIQAVGNYGEIFERNLGPDTIFKIERGLNALWSDGGLMFAPPFK